MRVDKVVVDVLRVPVEQTYYGEGSDGRPAGTGSGSEFE
jgi:hypothetical protein